MPHPIWVCLKHQLTMHTCRNVGLHVNKHHPEFRMGYTEAEDAGVVVEIGTCENGLWTPCQDPHNRISTPEEIQLAGKLASERTKMHLYQKCQCGWKSEPFPLGTCFVGLGGQLSCPECTKAKRNKNIEVYGYVYVVKE